MQLDLTAILTAIYTGYPYPPPPFQFSCLRACLYLQPHKDWAQLHDCYYEGWKYTISSVAILIWLHIHFRKDNPLMHQVSTLDSLISGGLGTAGPGAEIICGALVRKFFVNQDYSSSFFSLKFLCHKSVFKCFPVISFQFFLRCGGHFCVTKSAGPGAVAPLGPLKTATESYTQIGQQRWNEL